MLENPLEKLPSIPYVKKLNKLQCKKVLLKYIDADIELFNNIVDFCKQEEFLYIDFTASGALSYRGNLKYISRYAISYSPKQQSVELVIASKKFGCYRIILGHPLKEDKPNQGTEALKKFYKTCQEFNVDLGKFALTKEEGEKVKEDIKHPHIVCYEPGYHFNCYHLDFNSSHPAGIAERNPELRPVMEYLYSMRKEDDVYKDIMNMTQGIMQSQYCLDYRDKYFTKRAAYQFAGLSKDANNRTREMVELYIDKLTKSGREVLLTNTDGIWYTGPEYHDENEGTELGKWKTDYKNVALCIKSAGTYQILDKKKVINKCRGRYALDNIKPREEWLFGEILRTTEITYKYDPTTQHIIKKEQ